VLEPPPDVEPPPEVDDGVEAGALGAVLVVEEDAEGVEVELAVPLLPLVLP
jgi:hypothetical protein